jgi:hypothetical protein
MGQFFKRLMPAQYASKSFKLNIGKCREFMSSVNDNIERISDNEDSLDEEDRLICRERWAKKDKLKLPSYQSSYQSCANLNLALATKKVAKDILMKAKKKSLKSSKRKIVNTSKTFISFIYFIN